MSEIDEALCSIRVEIRDESEEIADTIESESEVVADTIDNENERFVVAR